MRYITTAIKYPAEARARGTEGQVFTAFLVHADGTLSDYQVIKERRPATGRRSVTRFAEQQSEVDTG